MKLRARLALGLFVGMAVVASILLAYYQIEIDELQTREGDARIATLSRHLAASSVLAVLSANGQLVRGVLQSAISERDVVAASVHDARGVLIAREARPGFEPPVFAPVPTSCAPCAPHAGVMRWTMPVQRTGGDVDPDEAEDLYDAPPEAQADGTPVGWVVVDVSTDGRRAARASTLSNAVLLALLVLLVASTFTLVLSRRLSSPLQELAAATREIGRGHWDVPVPKNTSGEIRDLAEDFEAMTNALAALDEETQKYREGLEEMVEQRTLELQTAHDRMKKLAESKDQFVATVSHDFRSPLAVVLASVQTVLRDPEMPPAVRERFLGRAEAQCQRLELLVTNLLDLARLENPDSPLARGKLADCVKESVESHHRPCEESGIELVYVVGEAAELEVRLDAPLFSLALDNLISNARKFTEDGGRIEVGLARDHDSAIVTVRDTGRGIAPDQLDRVFERFFQGEQGVQKGEGFGLGLSIVSAVAKRHDGTVSVTSALGEGTAFTIQLPLDQSTEVMGEGDGNHLGR